MLSRWGFASLSDIAHQATTNMIPHFLVLPIVFFTIGFIFGRMTKKKDIIVLQQRRRV